MRSIRLRGNNGMQIDWFTVFAQIVNFLVLMWLLKRFLYKPILNAIAAREKHIADQLTEATAEKAAAQQEKLDLEEKQKAFDEEKKTLMESANTEVRDTRERLLHEVYKDTDAVRATRMAVLEHEERYMKREIVEQIKEEVFSIAAKVLHDLADASLEERMFEVFIKRLHNLSGEDKEVLTVALESSSFPVHITSAYPMSKSLQETIRVKIGELLGSDLEQLQFKVSPELTSGIELLANGHKLAWSIENHLLALSASVDVLDPENDDHNGQSHDAK